MIGHRYEGVFGAILSAGVSVPAAWRLQRKHLTYVAALQSAWTKPATGLDMCVWVCLCVSVWSRRVCVCAGGCSAVAQASEPTEDGQPPMASGTGSPEALAMLEEEVGSLLAVVQVREDDDDGGGGVVFTSTAFRLAEAMPSLFEPPLEMPPSNFFVLEGQAGGEKEPGAIGRGDELHYSLTLIHPSGCRFAVVVAGRPVHTTTSDSNYQHLLEVDARPLFAGQQHVDYSVWLQVAWGEQEQQEGEPEGEHEQQQGEQEEQRAAAEPMPVGFALGMISTAATSEIDVMPMLDKYLLMKHLVSRLGWESVKRGSSK